MLTHLSIRNIVLIEACDLAFDAGLCVLTGETGAGKSILLDSLGLALGARGDSGLVRHGQAQGSVTAEFDIRANARAQAVMAEMELEADGAIIIRRSVNADGKGRVLVNDSPVGVAALKRLGETLVEIHGQHDQRGLMDGSTHRTMLDEFGHHAKLLGAVAQAHGGLSAARAEMARLEEALAAARKEEEYLRHTAGELSRLAPKPGEEDELTQQRLSMMQNEKLFGVLDEAGGELSANKGASAAIRAAQRVLMRSSLNSDGRFNNVIDMLDRAANETDVAHEELEALGKAAEYDPATLERIEERLFALKAAARKYGMAVEELPAFAARAEEKLALMDKQDGALKKARDTLEAARKAYSEAAAKLTKARVATAKKLETAILAELEPLKMGGTRFHVRLDALAENAWGPHGADAVSFEVATNVGAKADVPYSPLSKIASGGELSRFMLALKVAMSEVRSTPTLIFDEIDTGTGGAVAHAIGQRLGRLGESAQVLVVTHLPQVAARGLQHLRVSKSEEKGQVITRVEALGKAERKEELARMLAGAEVTPEARKAAQKLLETTA